MVTIPLTQGKTAIIDDEDADIASRFKWSTHNVNGFNMYATASVPQGGRKFHKKISLHALIMRFPSKDIDHINGNGLDCRKENLREVTHAQNMMNRKGAIRNSKTGFRGVVRYKRDGNFQAKIKINGKTIHLGYFLTAIEAARAYNVASLKFHGEFGRRNVVD